MSALRLSFGSQYKFPLKLYKVVEDGILIKWTNDGQGLIVEENDFEEKVMALYPGFVQVPTFHNLRRLFRDYNFKFRVLRRRKPHGAILELRHPFFTKHNVDKLIHVRKQNNRLFSHPLATSSPKRIKRKWNSSRLKVYYSNQNVECIDLSTDVEDGESLSTCVSNQSESEYSWGGGSPRRSLPMLTVGDHRDIGNTSTCDESRVQNPTIGSERKSRNDEVSLRLLQICAKNELSEDGFWELMMRRCSPQTSGNSWEDMIKNFDNSVIHELSPLHFKGYFYPLSLEEL